MSLTLSIQDLRRLESAFSALVSPLGYGSVEGWREASRHAVGDLLGADKSGSLYPFSDGPLVQVNPEDAWAAEAYAAYYHRLDTGLLQRRRELGLEVSHWSDVYDMATLPRTEIYNDWSRPSGFLDPISMSIDFADSPIPASWVFYHARETSPEFGERGLALLRLLLPAFKAGVHTARQLAGFRASLATLADQIPHGAAILDRSGRVLHENAALVRLLLPDPEAARVRVEATRLGRALVARLAQCKAASEDSNAVPAPSSELRTGVGRYALHGVYLPSGVFAADETVCVTVQRVTPAPITADDARRRFRLTAREMQVAVLLALGHSNDAIATELGISPHTAQRHTERVMAKLAVHSRAGVGARLRDE